jgi:hypothetical protein
MAVTDHQRVEWSAALRANLEQLVDLHAIVQERVDKIAACEKRLTEALERIEREKNEESEALTALSTASDDAVRRARLIGVKLEASFLENEISEDVYRAALAAAFPHGGQSIGTTPQQRLEALQRIMSAFVHHDAADPGGKLGTLAQQGAEAIKEANQQAKVEQQEAKEAADQLAVARQDFDQCYQATKEIVGGLLRDERRLDELRDVFPDM